MQRSIVCVLGLVLVTGATEAVAGKGTQAEPRAGSARDEQPHRVRRVEIRRGPAGGFLGVTLADVGGDDVERLSLEAERGARVTAVHAGTPAARAGVRVDDVIVRFDGEGVRSALQLGRLVRETPPGRAIDVDLWRAGAAQRLSVQLDQPERDGAGARELRFELPEPGELPELEELSDDPGLDGPGAGLPRLHELPPLLGARPPQRLGLSYQEISGQLAHYFHLEGERGVLVVDVAGDGPAARAGVKAGDLIVGFDGRHIQSGADLRESLRATESGQAATLKLLRNGQPLEVQVKLGPDARRPRAGNPT